jgi:uncharacterized protein (DUF1778 family)
MASSTPISSRPAKTSRIELRASEADRALLDHAAAALGTDRSSFLLSQGPAGPGAPAGAAFAL